MVQTRLKDAVAEKSTQILSMVMKDENDVVVPVSQVTVFTLTLYKEKTGNIINNKNAINILNANGGTWDNVGNVIIQLSQNDISIEDDTQTFEVSVVLLEWTYGGGAKQGKHQILFKVRNLLKVT